MSILEIFIKENKIRNLNLSDYKKDCILKFIQWIEDSNYIIAGENKWYKMAESKSETTIDIDNPFTKEQLFDKFSISDKKAKNKPKPPSPPPGRTVKVNKPKTKQNPNE